MKTARLTVAVMVLALWAASAPAQTTTNYSFSFSPNLAIPDGNFSGLALSTNLTGMGSLMTQVTVSLDITGGFNGDLYAYLTGPTGGFAVLLNRSGVTAGNAFGYSDTGFNVTFDDSASYNNIHFYQNVSYNLNGDGQLTGTWASDGRAIDPTSSPADFDTTPATATLGSFADTNPNGTWTLFVADLSSGGQSTLVSWGLGITAVPEPSTWALLGMGMLIFLRRKKQPTPYSRQ